MMSALGLLQIFFFINCKSEAVSCIPNLLRVFNPCSSDGKESVCNVGDLCFIPGSRNPLEKGIATHSSFLAWWVPWTFEPGGLQSMVLQRDGHNWPTNSTANTLLWNSVGLLSKSFFFHLLIRLYDFSSLAFNIIN